LPDLPCPVQKSAQLVPQVAEVLRSRLLSGEYPANTFLPSQGSFAREFNVSLPVVREAMRQLESQGLLEICHGKRPRVCALNGAGVVDGLRLLIAHHKISWSHLVEVRRALEGEIAGQAAVQAGPELADELIGLIDELREATTVEEQVKADERFHRALATATGNPLFGYLLHILAELLNDSRRKTLHAVGAGRALEGHLEIQHAIAQHDQVAARAAMWRHLDQANEDLNRPE